MLLARRLCHDLAGPVGAVGTAVEMLGDGGDPELVALAADGVAALSALLRLLRFAVSDDGASGEARSLVTAWLATRDAPTLIWADTGDWPPGVAPLTAGLALIGGEALRKGSMHVARGSLRLETPAIGVDDALAAVLEGHVSASTTVHAVAAILAARAAALGGSLHVEREAGAVTLSFRSLA